MKIREGFLLMLILFSIHGHATTLQELVRDDKLVMTSWLNTQSSVAPGEEVILYIDLKSDFRFTQPVTIQHFELPQVLVMPQSEHPLLDKEVRNDEQTRYHQRWAIKLYPLVTGAIEISPVAVELTVEQVDNQVTGKLLTKAHGVNVIKTSAYLNDDHNWLSAREVKLNQSWDMVRVNRSSESNQVKSTGQTKKDLVETFHIGDSITRKVHLSGFATSSMLLPSLLTEQSQHVEGIKAFVGQDEYFDIDEEKGSYAEHSESITFMLTEAGSMRIPDIQLYWWDTKAKKIQQLTLQGKQVNVLHTPMSFIKHYIARFMLGLVVIIGITLTSYRFCRINKQSLMSLSVFQGFKFYQALMFKRWPQAEWLLYQRHFRQNHKISLQDIHPGNESWLQGKDEYQELRYAKQPQKPGQSRLGLLLTRLWRALPG